MIVLVFDPLAVLMLVAANWNYRKEHGLENEDKPISPWSKFFKKEPAVDFPEKEPEHKEIIIEDKVKLEEHPQVKPDEDIPVLENEETWASRVIDEQTEIPEIQIDEASKEWEPELYTRLEEKQLGRYQAETQPKTQSFLNKVKELVRSPSVTVNTIEKEVEDLQKK